MSGKRELVGTYRLDEIARIEDVFDFDVEDTYTSTTIFFTNGRYVDSPILGEFFAQKLSEYTGKKLEHR